MECIVIRDPAPVQSVPANDRGFLLGDGVFDTLRTVAGVPEHLNAHLRRLHAAAAAIGLPVRLKADAVRAATSGLGDGVLRITLTRGVGPRGLAPADPVRPGVFLLFFPGLPVRGRRLRLRLDDIPCNEHSPLSRIKSLSRLEAVLATARARAAGCDEALLVNTAGRVCCAASGNVLYRLPGDRTWYTPPESDGALPGITLRRLRLRRPIFFRSLSPDEPLARMVITNSVRGVCRGIRTERT